MIEEGREIDDSKKDGEIDGEKACKMMAVNDPDAFSQNDGACWRHVRGYAVQVAIHWLYTSWMRTGEVGDDASDDASG
ncbi:hypothetical protein FS842_007485 [Serendipita sp. 407]|nr:hypothetical protein FS842_007485 [Serendipita sp. 407]